MSQTVQKTNSEIIDEIHKKNYSQRAYQNFKKYIQQNINSLFAFEGYQVLLGDVLSFHGDDNKYQLPRISFNFANDPEQDDWREIESIPVLQSTYPHSVVLNKDPMLLDFVMDAFCNTDAVFDRMNAHLVSLVSYAFIHQYIRQHKNNPDAECLEDQDIQKAVAEYDLIEYFYSNLISETNFKDILRDKLGKVFVFYKKSVLNKEILAFIEQATYANFSEYKKFINGEPSQNIDHVVELFNQGRNVDALSYKFSGVDNIEDLLININQEDLKFMAQNTRILNTLLAFVKREFNGNIEKTKFLLTVLIRNKHEYNAVISLLPLVEKISELENCADHIEKLSSIINLYSIALSKNVYRSYVLKNFILGDNQVLEKNQKPVVNLCHYNMVQEHWDQEMLWKYANDFNRIAETERGDLDEPFEITVDKNEYITYPIGPSKTPLNSAVHTVGIDLSLKLITSSKQMLDACNKIDLDLNHICTRLTNRKDLIFLFGYRGQYGVLVLDSTGHKQKFEILEINSKHGFEHDLNLRDSILIIVNELNKHYKSIE